MRFDIAPQPEMTPQQRVITHTLDRIGWKMGRAEVSFDADGGLRRTYIHLKRSDGLEVTLHSGPSGAAYLTREHYEWVEGPFQGNRSTSGWRHSLIGRTRYPEGPRSAARELARYLADNPASGRMALPRADVGAALRLMFRPAQIAEAQCTST